MSRSIAMQSINVINFVKGLTLVLALFTLSSCDLAANYNKADRAANAETQDFRDALAPRSPDITGDDAKSAGGDGGIPSLQPYISTASSAVKPMPLVSVSVNQSVPLRDTLFELTEQAGFDIELDPRITGAIILTARNKPFDEVITRICDMAGLRSKIENNTVRVELDEPYSKIYKIDYLSMIRSKSGSINTNVSVVSGEGADTGSAYSISSESTNDFWAELDSNLKQILGGASTGAMKTKSSPKISAATKSEGKEGDDDKDSKDSKESDDKKEGEKSDDKAKDTSSDEEDDAVLRVESLPLGGDEAPSDDGKDKKDGGATYSINKQAGILNVYATDKAQKLVEQYLNVLRKSVSAQVLIEAKVFEVALNDEYITGIDWGVIGLSGGEGFGSFLTASGAEVINTMLSNPGAGVAVPPPSSAAVVSASNLTIGYAGNDVQALLTAISGFGTVRALASPRLTVLNNQSGVLNVATNNVYFEMKIDSSYDPETQVRNTEVDSTIKSVPEGVLINVQPSINLENRTIALSIRPTVSRITGFQADPAVAFITATVPEAAGVISNIPELNIQEIDSIVQVRSGQPIVMGGLLQDRTQSTREGVPVLGELPVVGGAFRKHSDLIRKTELVIFLKATLLDAPEDTIDDVDRDIYRQFSDDRRPLKL